MSAYHFHAQIVSRAKGHSAVAGAAYRTGLDLFDERTQERKDYSRRSGVEWVGQFIPHDAPGWAQDVGQFWNKVEASENRKDAQLAREFVVAFPHELDAAIRRRMVTDFMRDNFTRNGIAGTVAIHEPDRHGDQRNHHAHIMLAMRRIGAQGFSATKDRDHNRPEHLEQWREQWAELGARQLERAGHHTEAARWRHGHKTLERQQQEAEKRGDIEHAQRCDKAPSQHRGKIGDEMQKRGKVSGRTEKRQRDREELQRLHREKLKIEAEMREEEQRQQQAARGALWVAWWRAAQIQIKRAREEEQQKKAAAFITKLKRHPLPP